MRSWSRSDLMNLAERLWSLKNKCNNRCRAPARECGRQSRAWGGAQRAEPQVECPIYYISPRSRAAAFEQRANGNQMIGNDQLPSASRTRLILVSAFLGFC